jgi:hypothetical protein
MRTFDEARQSALALLASTVLDGTIPVLLESETQELEAAWVFFYQSARYLQTQNLSDRLVGNGPIFVPRDDTPATHISYLRPLAESHAAYLYCGDPNACPRAQIRLTGWQRGALAISAIRSIREHSSLGLAAAKQAIDDCLEGKGKVTIDTASVATAVSLVGALSKLGFASEVTYGDG